MKPGLRPSLRNLAGIPLMLFHRVCTQQLHTYPAAIKSRTLKVARCGDWRRRIIVRCLPRSSSAVRPDATPMPILAGLVPRICCGLNRVRVLASSPLRRRLRRLRVGLRSRGKARSQCADAPSRGPPRPQPGLARPDPPGETRPQLRFPSAASEGTVPARSVPAPRAIKRRRTS